MSLYEENIKKQLESRAEYNKKILELISALMEKQPELRFCQILWALQIIEKEIPGGEIIDNYYEESIDTFAKISNEYKIMAQEKALNMIYPEDVQPKDMYEKVLEHGLDANI